MADQEHLNILMQGVDVWNEWRIEHPEVRPDLSNVTFFDAGLKDTRLSYANLKYADLSGANLSGADLSGADLSKADLSGAIAGIITIVRFNVIRADLSPFQRSGSLLSAANFRSAILSGANLRGAFLRGANFSRADLSHADMRYADLSEANLSEALLLEAALNRANLSSADLSSADLTGAILSLTIFDNVDLKMVKGLEEVFHARPSEISIRTIYRSQGHIPEIFLKGAGVDDTFITYIRSLVGKPIEYYSCFISYSSKDDALARRLYADLQSHNVRCWFAPEDLKWGERIRSGIDEAIRMHDKLLLILSKHSVSSGWVEREVKTALAREKNDKRTVLFPVRVDGAVFDSPFDWATEIRHERNIGDFTHWKQHEAYQKAFDRLVHDLKAKTEKTEGR